VSGPLISWAPHDATKDTRLILTTVGNKKKEESEKERKKK
jgi:hypothetical protein